MKIPVFTDEAAFAGGWHGQALTRAFAKRGCEAVFVELQDCLINLTSNKPMINLPGFDARPPLAFVRGIAAGSIQQVITRLNMLHMLSMQGTYIYNDAKSIERTVDKGMTSFLLMQHGVKTPATWVCESRRQAHAIIRAEQKMGNTLVIKPLFGSQGQGVRRICMSENTLPLPRDQYVDGVYYLQRFVDTGQYNYDFRVFIINQQPVATMRRSGEGWLHNVAQGASCALVNDAEVEAIALLASQAVGIDYCGVDVIRDRHGILQVLEVNSIPAWRGLQSVTAIDIAQCLVDDLLAKMDKKH